MTAMYGKPLGSQARTVLLTLIFVYGPVFILLIVVTAISRSLNIPLGDLMRDTTAVARVPFYTGIISNIGLFFWCAAATICLMSWLVLRRGAGNQSGFLLYAGFLTVILMLDDAFQLHEVVAPRYLNISDTVVVGLYGTLTLLFLYLYRGLIGQSNYALLLMALACLGAGLVFDKLHDLELLANIGVRSQTLSFLLEDGLKLLGIAGWLGYFGNTSHKALLGRYRPCNNGSPL